MFLVFAYVDIAWDPRSTVFLGLAMALCADFVQAHDVDAERRRAPRLRAGAAVTRPRRGGWSPSSLPSWPPRAAARRRTASSSTASPATTATPRGDRRRRQRAAPAPRPPAPGATPTRRAGRRRHGDDRRRQARRDDQPGDPRRVEHAHRRRAAPGRPHDQQLGRQPVDPVQLRHRPRLEPRPPTTSSATRTTATPAPTRRCATCTTNDAAGVQTRMAIPTLGWVAKNDDPNDCSFPKRRRVPAGVARSATARTRRSRPIRRRPTSRARRSRSAAWLTPDGGGRRRRREFVAMDNEPDLWGHTHYDVHPDCPTYEEILDKYLRVRRRRPRRRCRTPRSTGPALCCWYDYWHIAPGPPTARTTTS